MGLFDFLKPKKKNQDIAEFLPEQIFQSGALDLQDVIAPAALKVTAKSLNVSGKVTRTYFVISYPRFLTEGWFAPIINLDKIFDISIFVHPIDTGKVLKQFQKKVAEVQSQMAEREKKGMVRDPMLETANQDLERLRDDLLQANEKLFDVGVYFTIYADSEEELAKTENEVKSILESKLVITKPALFQQEAGFRSTAPLGNDELMVHTKLNSSPLSSIFPFVSFDLTSNKGILYGINRHNSSLILFDRFSLENYNSITLAKSGSGKSILGHEPVLIRQQGRVSLRPIGEVVEEVILERGALPIDHELEGVVDPDMEVWSFDKEMRGEWSRVTVAARKDAPKELYRFATRSGRAVETTGDHNMLVLRDGEIVATKSTEVSVGEYLPLPREVKTAEASPRTINLLERLADTKLYVIGAKTLLAEQQQILEAREIDRVYDQYLYQYAMGRRIPLAYFSKILARLGLSPSDERLHTVMLTSKSGKSRLPVWLTIDLRLAKILGYLVSEGTISTHATIISNKDPEVIRDATEALRGIGVCHFTTDTSIVIGDTAFSALLNALGMRQKSGSKRLPAIIFESPKTIQAAFLSAYFEGDGGVDGAAVTAISKSRMLISDLSYLLYSFGSIGRIALRKKRIPGQVEKSDYYLLTLSGQKNLSNFRERINFISERKKKLLAALERTENTNVDVVPGLAPLFTEIDALLGGVIRRNEFLSPLKRGIYNPSPSQLKRVIADLRSTVREIESRRSLFKVLTELPHIADIIKIAEQSPRVNALLWKELGSSWATIKNGVKPGVRNALKAFQCVGVPVPAFSTIKETISDGFAFLREPLTHHNPSLRPALRVHRESDTSYDMLAEAAAFITARYATLCQNIPRVEELLARMERLANADLAWDEIATIEPFTNERDRYVYDLTIDNEVFLAGYGGMFVHNSYMTKLEILRSLMFGTDVLVIDPEREYEHLAEATGGKYFNISLNSEHHINPFELPPVREDESPADVLRSNIINLVGLFRIMLGGLTPEEDAIIDRAISETYALKDITPDADFSSVTPPLLSDFELILSGMQGAQSLVERISKYTRGTWAGFINQPSNVDINANFIVFSLRDMEDELKPAAMYIVTHFIWNAIRRELKKRLLVIDEAWWMMKSEDTASFLLGLAKRGRKYYLGLSTITQDVDDFLKSPYGLPILTNSSMQMLLKQSPTVVDKLQQIFSLTDEEKYLLLESDVGEGLFFVGLKHVSVKVIASYTEDQIVTSDPSQLLAIKKAKEDLKEEAEK